LHVVRDQSNAIWRVLLVLGVTMLPLPSYSVDTCGLPTPPLDSAVNNNHGEYFFIYPRSFDKDFTGCQTMWSEKGHKVWIVGIESGKPKALTIYEPAKPATTTTCSYRDGALVSGPSESCVDFDALLKGIPSIPFSSEPKVPQDRDPRH